MCRRSQVTRHKTILKLVKQCNKLYTKPRNVMWHIKHMAKYKALKTYKNSHVIADKSRDERHIQRNRSHKSLQVIKAVTWDVMCPGRREGANQSASRWAEALQRHWRESRDMTSGSRGGGTWHVMWQARGRAFEWAYGHVKCHVTGAWVTW